MRRRDTRGCTRRNKERREGIPLQPVTPSPMVPLGHVPHSARPSAVTLHGTRRSHLPLFAHAAKEERSVKRYKGRRRRRNTILTRFVCRTGGRCRRVTAASRISSKRTVAGVCI